VFTARYALSPYIKQIRFVFKGLMQAPNPLTIFTSAAVGAVSYSAYNICLLFPSGSGASAATSLCRPSATLLLLSVGN
jgi:hypothetical protein